MFRSANRLKLENPVNSHDGEADLRMCDDGGNGNRGNEKVMEVGKRVRRSRRLGVR